MNNILENSISNIDDDLIEMTAQKIMRSRPRKTALNVVKFAGIAAAAAALCVAVKLGIAQYNDHAFTGDTVSSSDPANSGANGAVIMPLEDLVKLSDKQAAEALRGLTRDELILAWGKPIYPREDDDFDEKEKWQSGSKLVRVSFLQPDPENSALYAGEVRITDAPETLALDFKAQYIRTHSHFDSHDSYRKTALIKDKGELEKYYADNSDKYNLKWDDSDRFYQAVSGYDEEFFKDHCLLFVIVQEGSGSVSHNVKKVAYSAENGMIVPTIERIVPEFGTCDMAQWHIIIELDALYGGARAIEINFEDTQI